MIFDSFDEAYLKLCGLCRYMPEGLQKRYDSPVFGRAVVSNLEEHGLIKRQSNHLSFKLSRLGKKVLGEMGYEFPEDARMDLKRPAYFRKLKNAAWNTLLYLSGIDVFGSSIHELSHRDIGYVSSLMIRSSTNMRVLAGTRYFGILRVFDTVYIPYYAEGWIMPGHEKEIFKSQIESVKGVSKIQMIFMGETLEEVWECLYPAQKSELLPKGMRPFDRALEELPFDFVLMPLNRDGVMQMSILCCRRYRARIAEGLGCETVFLGKFSSSDGINCGIPYIIGIDLNLERITRALKQIERSGKGIVPKIACFSFQKNILIKGLMRYGCPKTIILTLDKKSMYHIFPELTSRHPVREPYKTTEGGYMEVHERTNKRMAQKER